MEKNMEHEMVTRQSFGVILRDEKDADLAASPAHTMGVVLKKRMETIVIMGYILGHIKAT